MTFQSAQGYVLFETGPAYTIMRAPIFGEVFVEWKSQEQWQARPPDAGRWEIEVRRDVDALKGHRQTVLVLGRCTLTYWPWEVVRKLLLLNRRTTRRTAPALLPPDCAYASNPAGLMCRANKKSAIQLAGRPRPSRCSSRPKANGPH